MNFKVLVAIAFAFLSILFSPNQTDAERAPEEREVAIKAIPGVIKENARWERVWAAPDNADGLVSTADGGILFAQEQTDRVMKLDADNRISVYLTGTRGAGSLSIGPMGRLFSVERTCTDPGLPDGRECKEPTKISVLAPERKILADGFENGASLGRLNDLTADSKGGAYFTVGGLYYVDSRGTAIAIEEKDIHTNGVALSPEEKTLYVTNRREILAFDVGSDGAAINRRRFALLDEGDSGDGMTVDAQGRLYVTDLNDSIHVFAPTGRRLGTIPTPRRPISVAFSGQEKMMLYMVGIGAIGPGGLEYSTPPGIRNNAKTIYKIRMLAQGLAKGAK